MNQPDLRQVPLGTGAPHTMQRIVVIIILAEAGLGCAFALPASIYGGNFNLSIPANDHFQTGKGPMHDAVLGIPYHKIIHDLDVKISLTHPNVFDLHIYLESPSGTSVKLISYDPYTEFFKGQNYVQTIFDDDALVYIKDGIAPFTGRFKPVETSRLSDFNGENIYGSWKLRILDAHYADSGTFQNFELAIASPEPDTLSLLLIGICTAVGFKPYRDR